MDTLFLGFITYKNSAKGIHRQHRIRKVKAQLSAAYFRLCNAVLEAESRNAEAEVKAEDMAECVP